jgi:hypothetical protein
LFARRVVLLVSALLSLVGLYWIGRSFVVDGQLRFGNPVQPTALETLQGESYEPRQVRAEVTHVEGNPVVREGDKCDFLVERRARDQTSFYCNAQVVCGGKLLYGGPNRGYFPCRLFEGGRRDVIGTDASTTGADQDAALYLNTRTGVLRVWDDARGQLGAFKVEADVLSVH